MKSWTAKAAEPQFSPNVILPDLMFASSATYNIKRETGRTLKGVNRNKRATTMPFCDPIYIMNAGHTF